MPKKDFLIYSQQANRVRAGIAEVNPERGEREREGDRGREGKGGDKKKTKKVEGLELKPEYREKFDANPRAVTPKRETS